MIPSLTEYKGKKLKAADRGELEGDKKEEKKPEADEKYKKLFEHLKAKLPEVSDVRLSSRLKESAAVPGGRRGRCDGPPGTADAAHGPRRARPAGRGASWS